MKSRRIASGILSTALLVAVADAFVPNVLRSASPPSLRRLPAATPLASQVASHVVTDARPRVETTDYISPQRGGLSMTVDELAVVMGGRGRARLAWDCYRIGVDPAMFFGNVISLGHDDFESIYSLLPSARRVQRVGEAALAKLATLYPGTGQVEGGVASLAHVSHSSDRTTKLLLRLADGLEVETVIIPWKGGRSTLCISSQVGCRQACTFCATGKMGIQRSLTSDEMLAQMFFARKICRLYDLPAVTNVVFMGMGEPADNAEAVARTATILTTRELFQLAATKVTISTVAPTPQSFLQFAATRAMLAWSVHAVRDDLRRQLVPTTQYSMTELRQGLINALCLRPKHMRTTMLEVALMAGVNDSDREADELADFARGIVAAVPDGKVVVNLIPYNDTPGSSYETPSQEAVQAFQKRLWSQGICAHVRVTRGDEKDSACGQLATRKRRELGQGGGSMLSP